MVFTCFYLYMWKLYVKIIRAEQNYGVIKSKLICWFVDFLLDVEMMESYYALAFAVNPTHSSKCFFVRLPAVLWTCFHWFLLISFAQALHSLKSNITPENRVFCSKMKWIIFQPLIFRAKLLVSEKVAHIDMSFSFLTNEKQSQPPPKPRPLKVQWKWSPPHLRGVSGAGWWVPTWNARSHQWEMPAEQIQEPRIIMKPLKNIVQQNWWWTYLDEANHLYRLYPWKMTSMSITCQAAMLLLCYFKASDFMSNPLEDARAACFRDGLVDFPKHLYLFAFYLVSQLMVNCWFWARWFGILRVHPSNNPFHKGSPGIQTTNPNQQLPISWVSI